MWKRVNCFSDPKILYLGLIQSLFEGSMYVFVLEWTPALTNAAAEQPTERKLLSTEENDGHRGVIPHGHIFAGFMVIIHLLVYLSVVIPYL